MDTGVKTDPLYWDEKNQKIISRVKEIGQESGPLNDILKEKLNKVNKIVEEYKRQFNVSPPVSFVKESYYAEPTKMTPGIQC